MNPGDCLELLVFDDAGKDQGTLAASDRPVLPGVDDGGCVGAWIKNLFLDEGKLEGNFEMHPRMIHNCTIFSDTIKNIV